MAPQHLSCVPPTFGLVDDGKAQDLIGRRELRQERVGHPVSDVQHPAPQPLQRLTDDHRARWPIGLGRSRTKDVEPGRDQHQTGRLGEEARGRTAKVRRQVRSKRRDPALVVP